MRKESLSVMMIVVFLLSAIPVAIVPSKAGSIPDYEPIDIGPWLRERDLPIDESSVPELIASTERDPYYEVGDVIYWLCLDVYSEVYFVSPYELRAIGTICEIWVQVDLSWPPGDPRSYPTILDEQIEYLLQEFETEIYPTDTTHFGMPYFHDGLNAVLDDLLGLPSDYYYEETGRNVILVSNIRDEHYYDPTYPYPVLGFYSPTFEFYFDRNIINIDCNDWEHSVGPEGFEWIPGVPVTYPFMYESVIAHEYQHLIHDDMDPDEDLWVNEGCAMMAIFLCDYGHPWTYIDSFMYTPDNSLTVWGDQGDINILADYGAAYLFMLYMHDHFRGPRIISTIVADPENGIDGINNALKTARFRQWNFDKVFRYWRIANLIHTDIPQRGWYNYKSINLEEAEPIRIYEISGLPVPPTKGTDFGTTRTILGYDTGVDKIGPHGSDYIMLNEWDRRGMIFFDGDDTAIYGWTMVADGWWSGEDNEMNTLLVSTTYIDPENPWLELTTKYDIEDYWDFGFVQVSTDEGLTWTSLENLYTTCDHETGAHPDIVANLPGLTGTSEGWSEWMTMTFDLSSYAGETVTIGFRYMTDWAALNEGWYINEATVSDIPLTLTPVYPEADFSVTVVHAYVNERIHISDMPLHDETEEGNTPPLREPSYVILIVSPITTKGFVDYTFDSFVPMSLSIKLRRDTITLGQEAKISGTLTAVEYPEKMMGTLVLEVSREGSDWQVLKEFEVSSLKSYRFSHSWTPEEAGDYTLRARYSGDETYSSSESDSVQLTVK